MRLGLGLGQQFNRVSGGIPQKGLRAWWKAEDSLTSISPDVKAVPGQTIRRVKGKGGLDQDQSTGNRQPILGYLEPPEGNLVLWSDDTTKFSGSDGGAVVGSGPLDPTGTQSVEIDFSGGSIWATGAGTPISSDGALQPVGVRLHVYAYVRTIDGGGSSAVRFRNYGTASTDIPVTEAWSLIHGVIVRGGGVPDNVLNVVWNGARTTPNVYVGRMWAVVDSWSPDYVPTTGTPIIPDTSGLPLAIQFDGVDDFLQTASNLDLTAGDGTTIFAVYNLREHNGATESILRCYNGATTNGFSYHVQPNGNTYTMLYSSGGESSIVEPTKLNEVNLSVFSLKSGDSSKWSNGVKFNNAGAYTSPSGLVELGARTGNNCGSVNISEILIYDRILSDNEIRKVELYLLLKYNLLKPRQINDLMGWWSVDNAYNSTTPTFAAPGQTIRQIGNAGMSNQVLNQATGNAQPVLGFLDLDEPLTGNLANASVSTPAVRPRSTNTSIYPTVSEELDPLGNPSIITGCTGESSEAGGVIFHKATILGAPLTVRAWVKGFSGSISVRVQADGWQSPIHTINDTEWTLIEYVTSDSNITPINVRTATGDAGSFILGTVWVTLNIWDSVYVPTTGTPVIPDTTNLLLAAVYDGANDFLDSGVGTLPGFSSCTLATVVKINKVLTGTNVFMSFDGTNSGFRVTINNSNIRLLLTSAGGYINSNIDIIEGETYVLIARIRNGKQQMLLNGLEVISSTADFNPTTATRAIIGSAGATNPITCSDTLFYTRYLKDEEVQDLHHYLSEKNDLFVPTDIEGASGWWKAEMSHNAVGSTLAVPGQTIRQVTDLTGNGRALNQATGANQPILDYLEPPIGNLINNSEAIYTGNVNTGWNNQAGAVVTNSLEIGPNGEPVIEINFDNIDSGIGGAITMGVTPLRIGTPYLVRVWLRTVSGTGKIRAYYANEHAPWEIIDDEWRLYTFISPGNPINATGTLGIRTDFADKSPNILVGRVHCTEVNWSDEYVPTHGTPVLPPANTPKTMVFDGVDDNLQEANNQTVVEQTTFFVASREATAGGRGVVGMAIANNTPVWSPRFINNWSTSALSSPLELTAVVKQGITLEHLPEVWCVSHSNGVMTFEQNTQEVLSAVYSNLDPVPNAGMRVAYEHGHITKCRVAEIIQYNRVLSPEEKKRVEDYLIKKYNIVSPLLIPGLVSYIDANASSSNTGTTAAAVGGTIRQVIDRSPANIAFEQATGTRQPILGYLKPPEGNLYFNTNNRQPGWSANASGGEFITIDWDLGTGPNGEDVAVITPSGTPPGGLAFVAMTISSWATATSSKPHKLFAWVKSASGNQPLWPSRFAHGAPPAFATTDWTLITLDINNLVGSPDNRMGIAFTNATHTEYITDTVYIGRCWLVESSWSTEYVPTTGTPVIPDTTDLAPAIAFDGVDDVMESTVARLAGNRQTFISALNYRQLPDTDFGLYYSTRSEGGWEAGLRQDTGQFALSTMGTGGGSVTVPLTLNQPTVITGIVAVPLQIRQDGELVGSATTAINAPAGVKWKLGNGATLDRAADVNLSTHLVYNRELSLQEIQKLELWMKKKNKL